MLGPAEVHPQEHLGEVGCIHAARTGADGDHRRTRIVLAAQQGLHLEVAERLLQRLQLDARLVRRLLVALTVGCEFDEHLEIVETLLDARDARELRLAVAERTRDLLGVIGVVPEVGHARFRVEACDLLGRAGRRRRLLGCR